MNAATDRRPVALVAAAVVAVVAVGLVLVFGVTRPPQLAATGDDPALVPTAAIAIHGWRDGESCVRVVAPDGATHEAWCHEDGGELLGWSDDGIVVRSYGRHDEVELVLDPETGEVVSSAGARPERGTTARYDGVTLTTSRASGSSGDLEVRLPDGTVLWRVDAPDSYDVTGGWRSPDGDQVALLDAAGRLLVVPADGSQPPRIWAEGFGPWDEVAWQGGGTAES